MSVNPPYRVAALWAARITAFLIPVTCVLWNLDAPIRLGMAFLTEQYLGVILGLVLATCYFGMAAETRNPAIALAALVAGFIGLAALGFSVLNFTGIIAELAYRPTHLTFIGAAILLLILEGLRRKAGMTMFLLVVIFLAYALMAHLVPGALQGRRMPIERLVQYVAFDPSALYASPLVVGAVVIILFVFFGNVLFLAGGGSFFTDLALALTGRSRGGSAKIAVVGSALFGSISGSAVSNVVTTGVVTIPLMRRGGYSANDAGAIEAVASTGGQLAPPIMGAAAFLMAEFLEIPYMDVVAAAALPALIYYVALFVQVDLMAARDGITAADEDIRPTLKVLAEGWHLLVPFAVLFGALFGFGWGAEDAALLSALSIVIAGTLRPYRGQRVSLKGLLSACVETGQSMVGLILIVAAAGMVIGVLNATGLGFALSLMLVQSVGANAILLLLIAAFICIVLGMGMPTSGVYVLLAALVAPALIEAGIQAIPAHLFILYFGMMSMITPPIALAAFAAATVSGAEPMPTGLAAVKIGWSAFILPFLFVASPSLLGLDGIWPAIRDVSLALIGIYLMSGAIVGHLIRPLGPSMRLAALLIGLVALPVDTANASSALIHGAAGCIAILTLLALWLRRPQQMRGISRNQA